MGIRSVRQAGSLRGAVAVPGDKSISHRALILAALAEGETRIEGLGSGADVRATLRALRALGARIDEARGVVTVQGAGPRGLSTPAAPIDCGNSGTTMRLLAGALAGAGIPATLDGDESLRRRPMGRVLEPLRTMGARARGAGGDRERAPLRLEGGRLRGAAHRLPVASAQVKTALLLAGLQAEGPTRVWEPHLSRDHGERMLAAFGADLRRDDGEWIEIRPGALRSPGAIAIPGDPSSGAFLIAAAILLPGSSIEVGDVGVNPTRIGWIEVLRRMRARVEAEAVDLAAGEPRGIIRARGGAPLLATDVGPEEIPALVDEVPILAVVATQASGTTTIRGAGELRVKESDRLAGIAASLRRMGAAVDELPDGLAVHGPTPLAGAEVDAAGDHRLAMGLAVAGLAASGETRIQGAEWADVSFPGYFDVLAALATTR
ncbi:MAG TPA: 3-phosphoshikimate 1-carboxyvinyltransferase [Vulgatibacter sp.]|nr:3-phosphoshikimate 1-carboxyvinyltransferase [Vulgatibacter sp.]